MAFFGFVGYVCTTQLSNHCSDSDFNNFFFSYNFTGEIL